jgi:hypothetical protein
LRSCAHGIALLPIKRPRRARLLQRILRPQHSGILAQQLLQRILRPQHSGILAQQVRGSAQNLPFCPQANQYGKSYDN